MNASITRWQLDHLVVAAADLDTGTRWCEATLGVAPRPGGRHAFMGTHNRLLAVGSAAFPQAYLEIIAIDRAAAAPPRPRWFDLDDAAMRAALERDGARLVHWVARSAALDADRAALVAPGHDPGEPVAAERATPAGLLRWRLTLRADGRRPAGGALPALIAWEGPHPTDTLPHAGVALVHLDVAALPDAALPRLPAAVTAAAGTLASGAALAAHFVTPRGTVVVSG